MMPRPPGKRSVAEIGQSFEMSNRRNRTKAAANPAKRDYLYYVVIDKQGNHAFASTLQEHEANIERARAAGVL